MKKNPITFLFVLLSVTLFLSGCADTTNIQDCAIDSPYGFWGGLWHGLISPISLIGSWIFDEVAMYAVNNNGGWYDFGFALGAGILFGGSRKVTK